MPILGSYGLPLEISVRMAAPEEVARTPTRLGPVEVQW